MAQFDIDVDMKNLAYQSERVAASIEWFNKYDEALKKTSRDVRSNTSLHKGSYDRMIDDARQQLVKLTEQLGACAGFWMTVAEMAEGYERDAIAMCYGDPSALSFTISNPEDRDPNYMQTEYTGFLRIDGTEIFGVQLHFDGAIRHMSSLKDLRDFLFRGYMDNGFGTSQGGSFIELGANVVFGSQDNNFHLSGELDLLNAKAAAGAGSNKNGQGYYGMNGSFSVITLKGGLGGAAKGHSETDGLSLDLLGLGVNADTIIDEKKRTVNTQAGASFIAGAGVWGNVNDSRAPSYEYRQQQKSRRRKK